jgi:NADH dehydrogenase [ubiquinone] 1 alpha subcomplex assembly factor 7
MPASGGAAPLLLASPSASLSTPPAAAAPAAGSADLSAWVDFSALRQAAEDSGAAAKVHGPVSQAHLLHSLGITARLEQLKQAGTPGQAQALQQQYERLVGEGAEGMGTTYQAMAIVQAGLPAPPAFDAGP